MTQPVSPSVFLTSKTENHPQFYLPWLLWGLISDSMWIASSTAWLKEGTQQKLTKVFIFQCGTRLFTPLVSFVCLFVSNILPNKFFFRKRRIESIINFNMQILKLYRLKITRWSIWTSDHSEILLNATLKVGAASEFQIWIPESTKKERTGVAVLFTPAKTWKQPKCPSPEDWIIKMWYIYIHNGILLSHKKKQSWVICRDLDGLRDCHTEWNRSEREKQISYINA